MLNISNHAEYVLETLWNNGYEAYCVGGAVRDLIMGNTPSDYDIATNALPQEVASLFPKTVATGVTHGTITVIHQGQSIEVTTYRAEKEYTDGRHPQKVSFISSLKEDLRRRDFTINAIAYSPKEGIIDPFDGREDIKNKTIRCVGEPTQRFREDLLRVMRCFRFSAKLNFVIESYTLKAAISSIPHLCGLSAERVFGEISRILLSDFPTKAELFFQNGGLEFWGIPSIESLDFLPRLSQNIHLRFAALCIAAECDPKNAALKLKTSNDFQSKVSAIYSLSREDFPTHGSVRETSVKHGEEAIKYALEIKSAVFCEDISSLEQRVYDALSISFPRNLSQLKISAAEIMDMGVFGRDIGIVQEKLFLLCLHSPEINKADTLKTTAAKIITRDIRSS